MPPSETKAGMTLTIHVGQGMALLAFDVDPQQIPLDRLAGFAVYVEAGPPDNGRFWLQNFLSFAEPPPVAGEPRPTGWSDSPRAPFQMFHWTHFPRSVEARYRYSAMPVYFVDGRDPREPGGLDLARDATATVEIPRCTIGYSRFKVGFTRGIIASQRYSALFHDDLSIRPTSPGSVVFDSSAYEEKWSWMGGSARPLLFEFLAEAGTAGRTLDVFAYDLDEPDCIRRLGSLGKRVRLILDDASLHSGPTADETKAAAYLRSKGVSVLRTHFSRFQHNKVLILRKAGQPEAVLTGSTNFSIRGLYVHANHVIRVDDPGVARDYADSFEQAWGNAGAAAFRRSAVAQSWRPLAGAPGETPQGQVAFSPHAHTRGQDPFSIRRVAERLRAAERSVFFSVMDLSGSGEAIKALTQDLVARSRLLLCGTTDKSSGVAAFRGADEGEVDVVPFGYLARTAPPPFRAEYAGGGGQHIHHKYLAIDFNGGAPVTYCGSSNLAAGGESENADNLLEVRDAAVTRAFAVEALALVDHYRFRSRQKQAGSTTAGATRRPLRLQLPEETPRWNGRFFAAGDVRSLERQVLVQTRS